MTLTQANKQEYEAYHYMNANSLLIIDDDQELCQLLSEYLTDVGYNVDFINTGKGAVQHLKRSKPSGVILDLMLPGSNGIDVLKEVRATSDVPILMISARGDEVDRIVGLESGADDYLPKPFSTRELVARMRALLRRASATSMQVTNQRLVQGDLEMDLDLMAVTIDGREVELTGVEFRLLRILVESAGETVSKDAVFEYVLQREASPLDRTLDTHISNLRKKIGNRSDGHARIRTIRNAGYMYCR